MGDAQTLSILLTFSNGDTQSVESDLTEVLAGFNGSTEPFALTGNLRTPVEGGFAGSIGSRRTEAMRTHIDKA